MSTNAGNVHAGREVLMVVQRSGARTRRAKEIRREKGRPKAVERVAVLGAPQLSLP